TDLSKRLLGGRVYNIDNSGHCWVYPLAINIEFEIILHDFTY
ncbi:MAG: hypothetical protein ACJAUM_003351, partial [Pseudomonadales bacterium]